MRSPTCLFGEGVGVCVRFWLVAAMFAPEGELFGMALAKSFVGVGEDRYIEGRI